MFDLLIIGFAAISIAVFVATKDKQEKPEDPPQTQTEEQIK
jgi:hypothetical protein